ncbi:related to meiosis-specific protein NDT80 [Cephalotrichum gorgonifer]|uniref:Related to meiosis-specific protein NDT80 n=1 Tax=Cephalotrichum gorgonifer TaxID=2041049 RepID=A0AAE8SRT8_9PEZI|nr:related to meiosis-specific protein NDT80 [Cephalotrichum gorgonifer]
MDVTYPPRSPGQPTIPPLEPITTLGLLHYADGAPNTPVRPEINGTIDKGFFLSDGEWTCYRRNYFSCVCSFSLTPYYQNMPLQFTPSSSQQTYPVQAFVMSISAVVSDNDSQSIELVQHTPKRDKGPIMKPEKVRMAPKMSPASHHPLNVYHGQGDGGLTPRGIYDPTYGATAAASQGGGTFQTEHTFERIQFKQATANNGKRRAAQQYYHLVIELYAEVGPHGPDQYVRVAYRRSAKMIVRGRSPGHYQTERRGSTSSGPGGGGGTLGGFGNGPMIGADFPSGGPMMGGGFAGGYENRGPYSGRPHHQHNLPAEAMIPPEDSKAIDNTKGYQYYPASVYEGQQDSRGVIEMFTDPRGDQESNSYESKGKSEYDGASSPLPSLFHPGQVMSNRRCGRFEGKPRSEGFYPHLISQSGMN